MGEKYKMTLDLSDYEEIRLDREGYLQEEADIQIYDYNTAETTYFRKKQPKQEFPIKIETIYGLIEINNRGDIYIFNKNRKSNNVVAYDELEQFEEVIKIAKNARDDGKL